LITLASISASRASMRAISRPSIVNASGASAGTIASAAAAISACSCATPLLPSFATSPSSAAWPRSALTSCVRWRTSNSRVVSSIARAWSAADFTATHARLSRCHADRLGIVSVVLAALDERLYCAGISRTRWPSLPSTRPQ